jgi:hypothetical protein
MLALLIIGVKGSWVLRIISKKSDRIIRIQGFEGSRVRVRCSKRIKNQRFGKGPLSYVRKYVRKCEG